MSDSHIQDVFDKLLPALQETEELCDLTELEYRGDRELLYAKFANGRQRIATVLWDSDTTIIIDAIQQII